MIIADEVQCGFARMGTHMWGIEAHDVVPDFITTGKPIGNGIARRCRRDTTGDRQAFGEQTGFFSTFGGNPVACAAGMAVLDVIEREELMERARDMGEYKRNRMRELMKQSSLGWRRARLGIADRRWVGERPRDARAATEETRRLVNDLRNSGVLLGREGPYGNVLKIRPPLVFGREHAEILIERLAVALAAL